MINRIAFIVLLFSFLFSLSLIPTVSAQEVTGHKELEAKEIQHQISEKAYKFVSPEFSYLLDLQFSREEKGRIYFGGFITESNEKDAIGKWISGSVPSEKVQKVKFLKPSFNVVY